MLSVFFRRFQVLSALAVGCVVGMSVQSCAFYWLATAHASEGGGTLVTVPCDVAGPGGMYAVQTFEGRSKEDLASSVYLVDPAPQLAAPAPVTLGGIAYGRVFGGGIIQFADGSAAVSCAFGGAPVQSVQFYVR